MVTTERRVGSPSPVESSEPTDGSRWRTALELGGVVLCSFHLAIRHAVPGLSSGGNTTGSVLPIRPVLSQTGERGRDRHTTLPRVGSRLAERTDRSEGGQDRRWLALEYVRSVSRSEFVQAVLDGELPFCPARPKVGRIASAEIAS